MEVIWSFKISVNICQTTWCYIPGSILSLRFLYGDEMGILYILSLDYAIHDQPVTFCNCFKFSHNLIDMLHHECERKERIFLEVFTIEVENTLKWSSAIWLSTIHTQKHLSNKTFQLLIRKVRKNVFIL